VARQPWYLGCGIPSLSPVGYFRFEDPAGEVGIETHLASDGAVLYQIPLTYRGVPSTLDAAGPLIATAEHSVLGTRWIYDGVADPAWVNGLLRLVQTNGVSDPSRKKGVGPAEARGHLLTAQKLPADTASIELRRVLTTSQAIDESDAIGLVTGTWHPHGLGTTPATGCLAIVHKAAA
jgi:hypothetical protein